MGSAEMIIKWKEPWSELWTPSKLFEEELVKEVGSEHSLFNYQCDCIGRREDCDEFLYKVTGADFQYAVVHLTFSGR